MEPKRHSYANTISISSTKVTQIVSKSPIKDIQVLEEELSYLFPLEKLP